MVSVSHVSGTEQGTAWLEVVKLQRTVECPICGRLAVAFEARSAWCHDCTDRMLAEQLKEMRSFVQEPEVVERPELKVVDSDV